ncbi:hypothetical protein BD289DRAFT_240858 [Coniella lustricola]|uniref:Uncharacterized protein n=1 Tax=Coniella lustricola TaxID=2025994 RepID=A0A2T3A9J4_9PEZI|nr:hypothetical protein BD289DRAFT_240858 [Coniella lustricola]
MQQPSIPVHLQECNDEHASETSSRDIGSVERLSTAAAESARARGGRGRSARGARGASSRGLGGIRAGGIRDRRVGAEAGSHGDGVAGQGHSLGQGRGCGHGGGARDGRVLREGKERQQSCGQKSGEMHGDRSVSNEWLSVALCWRFADFLAAFLFGCCFGLWIARPAMIVCFELAKTNESNQNGNGARSAVWCDEGGQVYEYLENERGQHDWRVSGKAVGARQQVVYLKH